jgi:hypothetical protein
MRGLLLLNNSMLTTSSSLNRIKSGNMFSMQYLQTIAAILIVGEIANRLSKDICKTREKQKNRERLLKLNWAIPNIANEIENKFFLKKYILFSYLLNDDFSRILKWINSPQTKLLIKSAGAIIFTVVLVITLTGIVLKIFSP